MKQKDIVNGARYRLARMQYSGRPDLNNKETTILRIRGGSRGDPNRDGAGARIAKYLTEFGVKVQASNVIALEDWYETFHKEDVK